MGKQFEALSEGHKTFIERQKIFFVETATADSRVNISPKGMDSLRVLNDKRVLWLNVTGSGNETAAHVQHLPRMTVMFCAFDDPQLILRLYGTAQVIHRRDPEWMDWFPLFKPLPGARQIFDLSIDLVQTSCGLGVPRYTHAEDRNQLNDWAAKRGEEGLRQYWEEKTSSALTAFPQTFDEV